MSVPSFWQPDHVRVFLSHSAAHKAMVGQVADALLGFGIHGFVAHDTMEESKPWADQIMAALRSAEGFIGLVHPEYSASAWCNQEVGWAYGRGIPCYFIRLGADPAGFPGHIQWPSGGVDTPATLAHRIVQWVVTTPGLGTHIADGLLAELAAVSNYIDSGAISERLAGLGRLNPDQFARLDDIIRANDQVHGCLLAHRALEPFYRDNGRPFPKL